MRIGSPLPNEIFYDPIGHKGVHVRTSAAGVQGEEGLIASRWGSGAATRSQERGLMGAARLGFLDSGLWVPGFNYMVHTHMRTGKRRKEGCPMTFRRPLTIGTSFLALQKDTF